MYNFLILLITAIELKQLDNCQLIKLCAKDPENRSVWQEFYDRFNAQIFLWIYREGKTRGLDKISLQFEEEVRDLVGEFYLKLVQNKCKVLREFKCKNEFSVYLYFCTIAKSIVINDLIRRKALKRVQVVYSPYEINDELWVEKISKNSSRPDATEDLNYQHLIEEINAALDEILKGKNKARDMLIFQLNMYMGFIPEEIANYPGIGLSVKRVRNIITYLKQELQKKLLRPPENSG